MVNSSDTGRVCIRCGKPRVVVSTSKEKINYSVVIHTVTACSDPACQKIVDELLKKEDERREYIKDEQEKREALRKETIVKRNKLTAAVKKH